MVMGSDQQDVSNDAIRDFNNRMGLLASHNYVESPEAISDFIADSSTGSSVDIQNTMERIFNTNIEGYITETFNGVLLNNVTNTNMYLRENMGNELQRVTAIQDQLKNQIYKTRIQIMEKLYTYHHNRFRCKVIKGTILLTLICFAILGAVETQGVSMNLGIILIALLLIVYVVILTISLRTNNKRRIDNWNKYYFKEPSKKNKK